jgi:hypothetical protein
LDRSFILSKLNEGKEVARIAKIVAILKGWAVAIEALPTEIQSAIGEMAGECPREWTALQKLVYSAERFGVWSTNQCIDTHRHPLYIGKLAEPLLEVLDGYATANPAAAATILHFLANWIGSGMFYDCPEESLVDNGKEPEAWIEALKQPEAQLAFTAEQDPKQVQLYFQRLLAVCEQHIDWRGRGEYGFRWYQDRTPAEVAVEWVGVYNDEPYWQAKADAKKAAPGLA